jgi:hypothetical protein
VEVAGDGNKIESQRQQHPGREGIASQFLPAPPCGLIARKIYLLLIQLIVVCGMRVDPKNATKQKLKPWRLPGL